MRHPDVSAPCFTGDHAGCRFPRCSCLCHDEMFAEPAGEYPAVPAFKETTMKTETVPAGITKADYVAYERVRQSGAWNMITQDLAAAADAGLDTETYKAVLKNYEACMAKWPDVRK